MSIKPSASVAPSNVDEDQLAAFASGAQTKEVVITPKPAKAVGEGSAVPSPVKTGKSGNGKVRRYVTRSYSMLQDEADAIDAVRKAAAQQGEIRGKSDVIRAGVLALSELPESELVSILQRVEILK